MLILLLGLAGQVGSSAHGSDLAPAVRLGVFSTPERARRYRDEMILVLPAVAARPPRVARAPGRDGARFNVYLDGFHSAAEARDYCLYISSLGIDCLVELVPRAALASEDGRE